MTSQEDRYRFSPEVDGVLPGTTLGSRVSMPHTRIGRGVRPQDLGIGSLFERVRDAVVVADAKTQRIVLWNPAAEKMFGYSPSEALEMRVEALVPWALEARHVIEGLRPAALDDFGLSTAIRLEVEELRSKGWDVGYEDTLGDTRLPAEVETALYRVAQEALTNARKHAETTRAQVKLARLPGKVRLEVRDFGRGFDPSIPTANGPGERVGLIGMRERVALLGGELEIRSKPGAGTSAIAVVPLPETTETDK